MENAESPKKPKWIFLKDEKEGPKWFICVQENPQNWADYFHKGEGRNNPRMKSYYSSSVSTFFLNIAYSFKGQLILKCIFSVFKSTFFLLDLFLDAMAESLQKFRSFFGRFEDTRKML